MISHKRLATFSPCLLLQWCVVCRCQVEDLNHLSWGCWSVQPLWQRWLETFSLCLTWNRDGCAYYRGDALEFAFLGKRQFPVAQ